MDNATHTVLGTDSEKCPGDYYAYPGLTAKWPCLAAAIEMRPGATITPGWLGWIIPHKDLEPTLHQYIAPIFELNTDTPDPKNPSQPFVVQVLIDPVPPVTSP